MQYKLLVFDWDGTLYDSAAYIVACVQQAVAEVGLPSPPVATIRQMIGLSFDQALKKALPNVSPMKVAEVIQQYRKAIASHHLPKPILFPGARETLLTLHKMGYQLAIATGKSRQGIHDDLAMLELTSYFHCIRTAEETECKPHPKMLLEIMEELDVSPEETLMIGDTEYDIGLAHNAKVDAVAAVYGVHASEQLQHEAVRYYLEDVRDLVSWLNQDVEIQKTQLNHIE